jgi:hypothetical protein
MSVSNRAVRLLGRMLANRYVVTIFLIAVAILAWKQYVRANDGGYITGRVVDEKGNGVAGAMVLLQERDLVIVESPTSSRTDEDGRFVFDEMSLVSFFIWAQKEGYLAPDKTPYHLYFKKQNFELPEPLILVHE